MRLHLRSKLMLAPSILLLVGVLLAIPLGYSLTHPAAAQAASTHAVLDCSKDKVCVDPTQKYDQDHAYVGHDEPSALFYSNVPGSGNRMQYNLILPTDPTTRPSQANSNVSANFQLHPTFWFGMAMCATESWPLQINTCAPDSDSNIVDVTKSPNHPGTAFMEMQFYPPGWVQWPNIAGSCDPTRWCAAINVDSLAEDPVNGTTLNTPCSDFVSGGTDEYVNFAFITRNGHAQGPANPVDSTLTSFTPDPKRDLFMNSGDHIVVTMHDSAHGLVIQIDDLTTHQSGSMTASAANGFGQVKYAPAPSTECTNIPYDFHPMYSTSTTQTGVPGRRTATTSPSPMRSAISTIAAMCPRMARRARAPRALAKTRSQPTPTTTSASRRPLLAALTATLASMVLPIKRSGRMAIRATTPRRFSSPAH